jgi:fatty acid amide hydrolase 2
MSLSPAYLRTLSARRLAALIRDRAVTSREVVQAHIDHARAVNGALNAIVEERYEKALAEAAEADAVDPAGPLHGVPCTIKESFALGGMPNSAGLTRRRQVRATEDAVTVRRLRAAGAIPIGVTNVSEACMWLESNNRVYGRSSNPYDPSRIVGGSSGGEGAIVASGASPFGLGSDVGGSIRLPAFFNGVFGHKGSSGLVPNAGQHPAPDPSGEALLSTGPLCRRAEDLRLLVDILRGPADECASCRSMPFGDPSEVRIGELVVLDVPDDGVTPVHPALRAAQHKVADSLREAGADVRPVRLPALKHGIEIWSAMMSDGNTEKTFAQVLGEGDAIPVGRELFRWAFGRSDHTIPALGLAVLERIQGAMPRRVAKMRAIGVELREELTERLGESGVMLYPTYAEPAPRHGMPLLPPTRWAYTALLNAMEVPATQVPLGLDPRGVPIGLQVAAAHGNDHQTIAVALELERRFGGWVPPRRLGLTG